MHLFLDPLCKLLSSKKHISSSTRLIKALNYNEQECNDQQMHDPDLCSKLSVDLKFRVYIEKMNSTV